MRELALVDEYPRRPRDRRAALDAVAHDNGERLDTALDGKAGNQGLVRATVGQIVSALNRLVYLFKCARVVGEVVDGLVEVFVIERGDDLGDDFGIARGQGGRERGRACVARDIAQYSVRVRRPCMRIRCAMDGSAAASA